MSVGKVVRELFEPHSKPVSHLCVPCPSPFTSHSNGNVTHVDMNALHEYNRFSHTFKPYSADYDIFISSANDNSLKLWDLRSSNCVRTYSQHVHNKAGSIRTSFSPCLRYIGCGSEDRCGYIYDIRMSTVLTKLKVMYGSLYNSQFEYIDINCSNMRIVIH